MNPERICFRFDTDVPLEDIAASLLLARWAAEGLHGEAAVRLEAAHRLDAARHECVIDALTDAGRDLAKIFCAFLKRELAPARFRIERLPAAGPAAA